MTDINFPFLEEYKALKAETREHLRLQNTIIATMLIAFCAAGILALFDWRGLFALLFFPWLTTIFILAWVHHELRCVQITAYISDRLEPSLDMYWSTYHKLFSKVQEKSSVPVTLAGINRSLSTLAFSIQWLFILLDISAVGIVICLAVFTANGSLVPPLLLGVGLIINTALIVFKYWLTIANPLEKYITLEANSGAVVVKDAHRELYPRYQQLLTEHTDRISIPPAVQSKNYFNCFYKQLILVDQGVIEIRDGSVSPTRRLDNRQQYVKTCQAGDIAVIPPGFSYIIHNPSGAMPAVIRHRRILVPDLLIR